MSDLVERVSEPVEEIERRIGELRVAVRRAVLSGDRAQANVLRAELRRTERTWDDAVGALAERVARTEPNASPAREASDEAVTAPGEPAADEAGSVRLPTQRRGRQGATLLPIREQVHHALTLLSVPAAPKLLIEVYVAFLGTEDIAKGRLTHLRRDEERSFRTAPYARPYYLCSTLTANYLTPVRGLLAVSTWPLERRIIGSLSPRVDFLTAAARVAEQADRLSANNGGLTPAMIRLLRRFAVNIPGVAGVSDTPEPAAIAAAARAELAVHEEADRTQREAGAIRATKLLDDAERLFGSRPVRTGGSESRTGRKSGGAGGKSSVG